MKRIHVAYELDDPKVHILHRRDRAVTASALYMAAARGFEPVQDLLDRRFPLLASDPYHVPDAMVYKTRESELVVGALDLHAQELRRHPLLRLRVTSLIGEMVVAAGVEHYPPMRLASETAAL